jgi:hypothetical protein
MMMQLSSIGSFKKNADASFWHVVWQDYLTPDPPLFFTYLLGQGGTNFKGGKER